MNAEEEVVQGGAAWRAAWKKADPVAREEAKSAVEQGIVVPRLEFAALAAGLAERERSQLRWIGRSLLIAGAVLMVAAFVFVGPRGVWQLIQDGWAGVLIASGWVFYFRGRAIRAKRSRDSNLELMRNPNRELRAEPPRRTKKQVRREKVLAFVIAGFLIGGLLAVQSVFEVPERVVSIGIRVLIVVAVVLGGAFLLWRSRK